MFLTLFVNTQREPLCEYVFNRCAKVFIFPWFSKPRRRIAHVFSYFLGVGWPRLAELGGWPGLAELGSSGIVLHAFSRVFVAQAHKTHVFSCFHSSGIVLHVFSCVFVAQACITHVFSCFRSSGNVLHVFSCVFVGQASHYTRFFVFS